MIAVVSAPVNIAKFTIPINIHMTANSLDATPLGVKSPYLKNIRKDFRSMLYKSKVW